MLPVTPVTWSTQSPRAQMVALATRWSLFPSLTEISSKVLPHRALLQEGSPVLLLPPAALVSVWLAQNSGLGTRQQNQDITDGHGGKDTGVSGTEVSCDRRLLADTGSIHKPLQLQTMPFFARTDIIIAYS